MLVTYKPDFCLLAEPWMDISRFPNNWFSRRNLKIFVVNIRNNMLPNLWCLCSLDLNPTVISNDDQQVSFILEDNNKKIGMSVIYASTNYIRRRFLWQALSDLQQNSSLPWSYIGYFNTILGSHEYRGAHVPARIPMEGFATWTDTNSLLHLPTKGNFYTWSSGREGRHLTEKT